MTGTYKFANILLSGPCNLACPECIGRSLPHYARTNTLRVFPLPGLEEFTSLLRQENINQVSLTGINTEPQLYAHETVLLSHLRQRVKGVQISLHTNGTRVLSNIAVFNSYDRATISIPSFDPPTYRQMTGSRRMPDFVKILRCAQIPIKVSTLVTTANVEQLQQHLDYCVSLGISRMVIRFPAGSGSTFRTQLPPSIKNRVPKRLFAGNPVYDYRGMEVTVWQFENTTLSCLNLFPDGTLSRRYRL